MKRSIWWLVVLAALFPLHAHAHAQTKPVADAGSAPTPAPAEPEKLADALKETTLGKLLTGQQRLSADHLMQAEFWLSLVKEPVVAFVRFVPRLFAATVFWLIFWLIHRSLKRGLHSKLRAAEMDHSLRTLLAGALRGLILGFGFVIVCNQVGIQITALLAGVSLVGTAVGFAAQQTLANFIAAMVLLWDQPFKAGDWIEVDGSMGQVQRIGLRSTQLLSGSGQAVILANAYLTGHKVLNHSADPSNRVSVPLRIAQEIPIEQVRHLLLSLVAEDQRIHTKPPPALVMVGCADGQVQLSLQFWIADESKKAMFRSEYAEKAKATLGSAGIAPALPRRQVFIEGSRTNGENPASRPLRMTG